MDSMSYNENGIRKIAQSWVFLDVASVLSRTTGKLPKHHTSASLKSWDAFGTGHFKAT